MSMTDAELFAPPPSLLKAPVEGDPAVWTVLGEAGAHPEGQRAVASTIINRARHTGSSATEVVEDPAQGYEAWTPEKRAKLQKQFPVGSAAYQAAQANVGAILSGQEPAPYEYDSFYSPKAQAQLGRKPPSWDDGTGSDVGGNLFFAGKYTAPAVLTEADKAAWAKLEGGRDVRIAPTDTTPQPGAPAAPQTDAVKFLKLHGFFDENATPGTSQRPLIETETSGAPTKEGTYYLPRTGGLRVVGSDVPDLLPQYRNLIGTQKAAMEEPLLGRLAAGAGQGFQDVVASANKLTGGGFAADPMSDVLGGIPAQDMAQASMQGFDQARDRFNLVRSVDPAARGGRMIGNLATVAPLLATGESALGALAGGVRSAAPAVGPAIDFLSGNAGAGNLLLRIPSKAIHGAEQGAGVSLLNSSQSDRPLGDQLSHGAQLGALMTGALPVAGAAKNMLMGSNASQVAPEVADLAGLATQKYGIPLRTSQIKGVADRNMAVKDSEMISRPGTGFAANNTAQRQAFTKAVASTFGADADKLTPEVMQSAKTRLGNEFERIAGNTNITDTNALQSNLQKVVEEASQVLPDSDVAPLAKQVANIGSAIKEGVLSGQSYQALTRKGSPLDRATESSNSNIRSYAQDIRHVLDDALEAHATPEDAAALSQARFQYKNLMTVKNLAAKAGVSGEISPTLLNGAVNTSFKNRAFQGAGDLGELAQIGQTFMREPPNSGTAPRLREVFKGAMLGGGGVADLMLAMHDPVLAAKLAGGAAGLGALRYTGNMISGAANRSPSAVNRLITRGTPQADDLSSVYDTLGRISGPTYVPAGVIADRNRLLALPAPLSVP